MNHPYPRQVKKHPNLKEALLACLGFSIIGLFNLGFRWEERTAFVENITWEIQSQLTLSKSQRLKIMEINYEFYDAVSRVEQRGAEEQITRLIGDKNRKIMNILNEDQKKEWLKSHLNRTHE